MASYILPILFIAGLVCVSLCISYLCVELIVRLIGRGLGAGGHARRTDSLRRI